MDLNNLSYLQITIFILLNCKPKEKEHRMIDQNIDVGKI